jgi:hypothetical protein
MRGSRPAVRAAAAIIAATAVTTGFLPEAAYADGTYRWQNEYTRHYLEVYKKSKANGAIVNVWSYNGGKNQLWKDTKLSNGYYRIRNVNSGRSMDRWDQNFRDNQKCPVTQWGWWGGAQQQWRVKSLWSSIYGRRFILWHNRKGCMGNSYHDTLGVPNPFNASNVILYSQDYCTEGRWIGKGECFWRRNGK